MTIRLIPTDESRAALDLLFDSIDRALRPTDQDLAPVGRQIRLGFATNFGRESNANAPWAPLAESTVRDRIREGYSGEHPILRRSHDYADSYGDPNHPDHVSEILRTTGRTAIHEGSRHELAVFHEGGTVFMPARPVAEDMPADVLFQIAQELDDMHDRLFLMDR